MAVMGQTLTKEPPRPSQLRPDMDQRVETVCLQMMAKTPSERFASLKAVADELSTILKSRAAQPASDNKPAPARQREISEQDSGDGKGRTPRIGVLHQFRRPLNAGGWIPWSVLTFGLAAFAVLAAVIVNSLGRNAVIDGKNAGVEVAATGTSATITHPGQQSTTVVPDDAGTKPIAPGSTVGGKTVMVPPPPAAEQTTIAPLPPTFKNNLGMEFVLVPKGKSWLGGGAGKPSDKEVVMAHDFYLGKYEVTQEEWCKLMVLNPSWFSRTGGGKDIVKDVTDADLNRFPVENVAWDALQAFLERLNGEEKVAGWVYRLPQAGRVGVCVSRRSAVGQVQERVRLLP